MKRDRLVQQLTLTKCILKRVALSLQIIIGARHCYYSDIGLDISHKNNKPLKNKHTVINCTWMGKITWKMTAHLPIQRNYINKMREEMNLQRESYLNVSCWSVHKLGCYIGEAVFEGNKIMAYIIYFSVCFKMDIVVWILCAVAIGRQV